MRCLVSGGFGFIGSNLAGRLIEDGWQVDVVDDLSNGHTEFLEDYVGKFKPWIMDFSDPRMLAEIGVPGRYDVVFHLAAIPRVSFSVEHPGETTDINTARTVKLMEACVKGGVKRFIFASSSSVYGGAWVMPTPESEPKKPVSPYAMQKHHVEEYCKLFAELYDFDSVCLRYFNVFGPNQYGDSPYSTAVSAWCDAVKHGKPLRSDGDGEQTRDMCYVDNVVDANICATRYVGKFAGDAFNVACQERTSNNEILAWFRKQFKDIDIVHAPERAGDVKHTCASIEKARNMLGYEPTVRFWHGLIKTIRWWKLVDNDEADAIEYQYLNQGFGEG